MLLVAAPPMIAPQTEDTVLLLDVVVMCVITYFTYTRLALCWRNVLSHMYIFFIVAWAYAETHGLLRPNTSLALRWLNAWLCFVNMAMQVA
jgi:hypothetical protein